MKIRASRRPALMLATGLFVCFAGPPQATASADNAAGSAKSEDTAGAPVAPKKSAKHGSRHWKSHAARKSSKVVVVKSDTDKTDTASDNDNNSSSTSPAIPSWVANANARLASADTSTEDVKAMAARANEILQNTPDKSADVQPAAESEVVSADQLNDVDRARHEGTPPAPMFLMAAAEAPAEPAAPAAPVTAASSNESSAWEQTSLIGKIFIGFGALLTMASAARMFIG
jgi:hypothetical protein